MTGTWIFLQMILFEIAWSIMIGVKKNRLIFLKANP